MNNALLEADQYLKQAHRFFLNRKYEQRITGNGSILKTDSQIHSKQEIWTFNLLLEVDLYLYQARRFFLNRKYEQWITGSGRVKWNTGCEIIQCLRRIKALFLLPTMSRLSVDAKARASFCCCVRCSALSTSVFKATAKIIWNDFMTQYCLYMLRAL